MPKHSSRLSPALILAIAALILASGATAIAAGELITRGDQIAPGVIDGNHIKAHSIDKTDVQHPTLRLRVRSNGLLFGDSRDATAKRDSLGVYVVTFDRDAIDGASSGPRNPRWLDDCAVVATPRTGGYFDGAAQDTTLTVMHTATSAVVVIATRPDYQLRRSVLQDTAFEIAAIC